LDIIKIFNSFLKTADIGWFSVIKWFRLKYKIDESKITDNPNSNYNQIKRYREKKK